MKKKVTVKAGGSRQPFKLQRLVNQGDLQIEAAPRSA